MDSDSHVTAYPSDDQTDEHVSSLPSEFTFDFAKMYEISSKLEKALLLLSTLSATPSAVFETQAACDAYFYIGKCVAYGDKFVDHSLFVKHKLASFLGAMLMHLYHVRNELDFFSPSVTNKSIANGHMPSTDLNEKRVLAFANALYVINITMMSSVELSLALANEVLSAHSLFIGDEAFVVKNAAALVKFWHHRKPIVDYLVMNISSLSKTSDEWEAASKRDLQLVERLVAVRHMKPSTSLDAFIAITNLVDDKQIEENFIEVIRHEILGNLIKRLEQCARHFSSKSKPLRRKHRQLIDNNETINCKVHVISLDNNTTMNILTILQALYKLCVNDLMRKDIYFLYNVSESLQAILGKANYYEAKYTLRLLAQLTFNAEVCKSVTSDLDMQNTLKSVEAKYKENGEDAKRNAAEFGIVNLCKQIRWNLQQHNIELLNESWNQSQVEHSKLEVQQHKDLGNETSKSIDGHEFRECPSSTSNSSLRHVMISYNTASRELCMRIKSDIEAAGHKVWIDVNDMHGSSLNSMAEAIEQSYLVIICVTEKYRQSINCQAEAQYAFRLNKPILPLILQSGYEKVKGWLGIVIGDKIFINFTKYAYDECVRRLTKELSRTRRNRVPSGAIARSDSVVTQNSKTNLKREIEHTSLSQKQPEIPDVHSTTNNNDTIILVAKENGSVDVDEWSEGRVIDWFEEKGLNLKLIEAIGPCSGIVLHQLFKMKNEAPQFFYQSLKTDQVDLNSLMMFTFHLENLFS